MRFLIITFVLMSSMGCNGSQPTEPINKDDELILKLRQIQYLDIKGAIAALVEVPDQRVRDPIVKAEYEKALTQIISSKSDDDLTLVAIRCASRNKVQIPFDALVSVASNSNSSIRQESSIYLVRLFYKTRRTEVLASLTSTRQIYGLEAFPSSLGGDLRDWNGEKYNEEDQETIKAVIFGKNL